MAKSFSIRKASIQSITVFTGNAHFVAQTAADIIAHTEGYLVNKIDKNISKQEAIAFRRSQTKKAQQDYKRLSGNIGSALKSTFTSATVIDKK